MKKLFLMAGIALVLVSPVFACPEAMQMAHWANLRDDTGAVIGTVGCGSAVEVIGDCPGNPDRTVIYDYATGTYGSVASIYLYGGTDCQYENPLGCNPSYNYDYTGSYGYGSCEYDYSEDSYGYTEEYYDCEETYVEPWAYEYDEDDTWAADNPEWLLDNDYEEEDCDWQWQDYGECSTKIDVDIGDQVVNIYVNGTIVLSGSCVTGMAGVEDTPCGTWTILDKQRDATLVGEDYAQPVSYWMPFTESGCGFHDAGWRDDFGYDIYQYSGSHGCVNLEPGFAEQMYEYIDTGCTVNIHE